MFRKSLAPDRGMLFPYKPPQRAAFWMKNTLIPLDIIYIAPDGRVLSIARNAVPHDETPIPSGGVFAACWRSPAAARRSWASCRATGCSTKSSRRAEARPFRLPPATKPCRAPARCFGA
jgi:hypothetical protein